LLKAKLGDEKQATAEVRSRLAKLHEDDPSNSPLGYYLAQLHRSAEAWEPAEKILVDLVKLEPTAEAYQGLVEVYRRQGVSEQVLERLAADSPLGTVLAAGLRNHRSSRYVMKEAIEEAGRAVAHEMERFLTTLGTIATASPLLGLFGTVIGMIEIFASQSPTGSNPAQLAHGISIALYNTAFGIGIAVPSLIFYRHFRHQVDTLIVEMEEQASKLVDILHGERVDAPLQRG